MIGVRSPAQNLALATRARARMVDRVREMGVRDEKVLNAWLNKRP